MGKIYQKLHKKIVDTFNSEELRILAYYSGRKYDELIGSTMSSKTLSLINYVESTNGMDKLINELYNQRPTIPWREFAQPENPEDIITRTTREKDIDHNSLRNTLTIFGEVCAEMEQNNSSIESNINLAARLSLCFENWETLHQEINELKKDINSNLVYNVDTLHDGKELLDLVIHFCDKLSPVIKNSTVEQHNLRPGNYLQSDMKRIRSLSSSISSKFQNIEAGSYAKNINAEDVSLARREIIYLANFIGVISKWLMAVIAIIDSHNTSPETNTIDTTE